MYVTVSQTSFARIQHNMRDTTLLDGDGTSLANRKSFLDRPGRNLKPKHFLPELRGGLARFQVPWHLESSRNARCCSFILAMAVLARCMHRNMHIYIYKIRVSMCMCT